MQETDKKVIDKKVIDYLKDNYVTYDKSKDCIYIRNVATDAYDIKVICEKIKNKFSTDLNEQMLKQILSDNESFVFVDSTDILCDIYNMIDESDDIPKSDWEQYKDWKEKKALWHTDKDGIKTSLVDCIDNVIGFINNFPKTKGKIKYNKIRNIIEYDGRQVVDRDYHKILEYINRYFMGTFSRLKMIKDAVDNVGYTNEYNKWTEYMDNLKYEDDGIDYIDYTIREVLHCENQEKYYDIYYETLKIMFLGNISRIYNKELYGRTTKFDTVVTICSRNGGSGKTTFFEKLYDIEGNGNSYCYVVPGDSFQPKDRDFIERSHQCVCLLLDEISMRRSIVTSVKGYITLQDDRFRKAYGFNSESHIRGFIITATSNNDDILKDYTTDNERRWLIIKIADDTENYEHINKAFDTGYRDKIWAYMKHIYDTEDFKLYINDKRLIDLETSLQRGYKASNNADYNTIINDLMEREYGFVQIYDKLCIDTDYIVEQYKYGDSLEWCKRHNEEMRAKEKKAADDKYILQPKDKWIMKFGKINRISKKDLYDILNKLGFEWTKVSLNAEIRYNGNWNGWKTGSNSCRINGTIVNAYWRISEAKVKDLSDVINQGKPEQSEINFNVPVG